MKRYLLDTSIIVAILRYKPGAADYVTGLAGELNTSYISVAELYEGINRVENKKIVEKGVLDFCAGLSEVFGLDLEIAQKFGEIKSRLLKKGNVIEDLDMLIAATAMAGNMALVTLNAKHFERIEGLEVISPDF
jgi:predicted nucleic acid-binding protein